MYKSTSVDVQKARSHWRKFLRGKPIRAILRTLLFFNSPGTHVLSALNYLHLDRHCVSQVKEERHQALQGPNIPFKRKSPAVAMKM